MTERKKEGNFFRVTKRIINNYLSQKEKEMLNTKREKAEQPLPDQSYLLTLFWFLLEVSPELTGINFINRFKTLYDEEITKTNAELRACGMPPLHPHHPDIIRVIEESNANYIIDLFQTNFVRLKRTSAYDCVIKYKINGNEKLNLIDSSELVLVFQENYRQSHARSNDLLKMIVCNEIKMDGVFLEFHLIHYGKWTKRQHFSNEISLVDSDFNTESNLKSYIKPTPILKDFINNKEISVQLKDTAHFLIAGETNSGKTTFATYLTAKLCVNTPNSELFILDYKGDDSLTKFKDHERYFCYKDCQKGMLEVYKLFSSRLENTEPSNTHIICYFDELASYINSFEKKSDRDEQQRMIAEILMMGRSKSVNFITSVQRPDAQLFALGSRINYSFKFLMGSSCGDSHASRMMFDTSETTFKACKQGSGYVSINGSSPVVGTVPHIKNINGMYKVLHQSLENRN